MRGGGGRVVADFLRTLSVQPFYVSFIDLVLFLPRLPLEPFLPPPPPSFLLRPAAVALRDSPTASGATTPCQDVKAVVKRRASAINHSRSRYYARNPRVLVGMHGGGGVYTAPPVFFYPRSSRVRGSAIPNGETPRHRRPR